MAFKNKATIVQEVILALRQVPGTGVQLYAEDIINQSVQDAFDIAFSKHFFDEYTEWFNSAVVGGLPTDTTFITDVVDIADIDKVYRAEDNHPLTKFPTTNNNRNKYNRDRAGTTARHYDSNPNSHTATSSASVIKIQPITATDDIDIRARKHPGTIGPEDIIRIDHLYMRYLAVWMYLSDDGDNPDAMDKYEILAEDRFNVITSNEDDDVIDMDNRHGTASLEWGHC